MHLYWLSQAEGGRKCSIPAIEVPETIARTGSSSWKQGGGELNHQPEGKGGIQKKRKGGKGDQGGPGDEADK